ncbi:MAG: 50S ribosomal protein L3 [Erysipelotrichaceae bacterium]
MKGILGRKLGMTQVFTEDGTLIPVTVIEATPNVVLQKKTEENDGYTAVQLGFEDVKAQRATKASIGHAAKVTAAPKRFAREIRGEEMTSFELGSEVKVDIFAAGEAVDVIGTSKGKGYTGAIVRNNQKLGPASHGSGHHRGLGSLATIGRNNGVINKGRIMAGQEGGYRTTNQNLEIIKVDVENNVILVKGNVPGPKRGMVMVQSSKKAKGVKTAAALVDYTKVEEE